MYRLPPTGPSWPAAMHPVERRVRPRLAVRRLKCLQGSAVVDESGGSFSEEPERDEA